MREVLNLSVDSAESDSEELFYTNSITEDEKVNLLSNGLKILNVTIGL